MGIAFDTTQPLQIDLSCDKPNANLLKCFEMTVIASVWQISFAPLIRHREGVNGVIDTMTKCCHYVQHEGNRADSDSIDLRGKRLC